MPKPAVEPVPTRSAMFIEAQTWLIKRIEEEYGARAREIGSVIVMDADEPREIEASDERVVITCKVEMKKQKERV
jgi:hypothetical protein